MRFPGKFHLEKMFFGEVGYGIRSEIFEHVHLVITSTLCILPLNPVASKLPEATNHTLIEACQLLNLCNIQIFVLQDKWAISLLVKGCDSSFNHLIRQPMQLPKQVQEEMKLSGN